jgi:hypothetical protein
MEPHEKVNTVKASAKTSSTNPKKTASSQKQLHSNQINISTESSIIYKTHF